MDENYDTFGKYLEFLIIQKKMKKVSVYTELNITKTYFFDVLKGRIIPPVPKMQIELANILKLDNSEQIILYELAAKERGEVPVDITLFLEKADNRNIVRKLIKSK